MNNSTQQEKDLFFPALSVFLPAVVIAVAFLCGSYETARADDSLIPIQTIMLESRGESLEGQIAVGEIIRNRAFKAGRTFEAICMAPRQFSAWNNRLIANKALSGMPGSVYQRAANAWQLSETSNLTKGSTHYHTLKVHPYWAKGHKPVVIIGNHVYYRGIK